MILLICAMVAGARVPIDPTKPIGGVPAEKADLRASLQAAKDGVEGAHAISMDSMPITIDDSTQLTLDEWHGAF